ncbi:LysR family transcriptional regulator [Pseudaminobacter salicylatoxidans]|uniref:LysR family transcriptional regulator n=1 Tax=Pseudaminobacter salicylatoxidans TaxID=93369 RepID=UPI0002D3543D|nr:LysR family transcriptional regulator [Pseudaminobacter salicylatoxidans]
MLITLDLRQIRYFTALFEEGSITRAAERLHVVQPAVSMQIRKLEAEYGLTLFDRTSQGVLPNDIARDFYKICLRVMEDIETAHHFLVGANGRVMGDIAVGVPPTLSLGTMARIVRRYCEKFPEVKLRILEGYSSSIVSWLESGEIDIGVLTNEYSEAKLFSRPLIEEELFAVTARNHPKIQAGAVNGREFAALDVILPSEPNLLRRLIDTAFAEAGVTLKPALEIDSLATVLELVRDGYATLLPGHAIAGLLDRFDLQAVPFCDPVIRRKLIACYNSQKLLSKAAEAFINTLREDLAQYGKAADDTAAPPA